MKNIYDSIILEQLKKYDLSSPLLESIVKSSILRLLDSKMIIEDPLTNFANVNAVFVGSSPHSLNNMEKFLSIYENTIKNGLGPHFHELTIELFWVLLMLCASESQKDSIQKWAQMGKTGCFLMTDKGGPSINQWKSVCYNNNKGEIVLNVDKIWAISGQQFDYTVIGAKTKESIVPRLYLLSPDDCSQLSKTTS